MDEPRFERRAVDHVQTVTCDACDRKVDIPREEPWRIDGERQFAPQLVAFVCPHCEHEIRLRD